MNGEKQNKLVLTYSLLSLAISFLFLLWVALTPSSLSERVIWNYSREKFFLVMISFVIFIFMFLLFLGREKR
jgi:hypothetical protein